MNPKNIQWNKTKCVFRDTGFDIMPQRLAASQGANADAWNYICDIKHSVH